MSRCVKIPELSEADNPFGEIARARTTPKGGKCGGSPEGTALTAQCAEGVASLWYSMFSGLSDIRSGC